MLRFQDVWSRWHHKPIREDQKYSSGNGWIYSAECKSVGLPVDDWKLGQCFLHSRTEYGFKRHPDQDNPGVSHDEVLGMVALIGPQYKSYVQQWANQGWQICDLPGFKPVPWIKLNWFGVISDFYKIYQLDKLYTKSGGKEGKKARHATQDFPRVFPIAFHMGGWKRYLIKRHINVQPGLRETLSFFFAKLFTIYGTKEAGPSQRLLGFQLKMLKNKTGMESLIDKLFSSKFDLKAIVAQEYREGHPILEKL